jgi:ABC-2 type transport system permease protein
LIALALGFGFLLALWFLGGLAEMTEGTTQEVLSYISILNHTDNLNKGLLYSKDIIYFLSTIFIFLFATQQRIEAYRW